MTSKSIEEFIANTMLQNFVNSDDTALNVGYIDIYWHTNTKGTVATNAENGLYNFHTFLINCRQHKNIYTDFKFEAGRLRIDISYKEESTVLIDTTLPEVTDYNKIYEEDVTAKVQVYVREDGSEYNLYLRTDRTTTTNKDDPNRANGKIEVISVDTTDRAEEEALNVMKGNNYKHLVEFKIAKTSKLMDITKLHIGRPIRIKTDDDIYDSYISAITLSDENFVYFKSGSLRITLLDKLKKNNENIGNKVDVSGGKITGLLNVNNLEIEGLKTITDCNDTSLKTGFYHCDANTLNVPIASAWVLQIIKSGNSAITQIIYRYRDSEIYTRNYNTVDKEGWKDWYPLNQDSGWKTATLKSGFKAYSDNGELIPEYRRVGKFVEIRGVITPTSDIDAGGSANIFTLPAGYRPSEYVYKLCQGSGRHVWMLTINSADGIVSFARYGTSGYEVASAGTWLPFNVTFLVD